MKQKKHSFFNTRTVLFISLYCNLYFLLRKPSKPKPLIISGDSIPYPIPAPYRQHHRCNYQRVPYVVTELASAQLLFYSNFSLIRFGDLDLDLMRGVSWPIQNATRELTDALLYILHHPLPRLYYGIYDPFSSQSRCLARHQNFLQNHDIYRRFLLQHLVPEREYLSTLISSPYVLNANTSCILVKDIYDTLPHHLNHELDIRLLLYNQLYIHFQYLLF